MKLQRILLYLLISATLFFSSCQKEISTESGLLPGPVTSAVAAVDSIYPNKLYDGYPSGTGIDTAAIFSFHYDNVKRVISINDSMVTPTGPVFELSFNYSYAGNDTIPNKSIFITVNGISSIDTVITYFYYDAAARHLKDSILGTYTYGSTSILRKTIVNYSYSPGYVYGQTTEYNNGVISLSRDTALQDLNGNIINNKKYKYSGGMYLLNTTSDFTYDNHLSLFARLSNAKAHQQFPNGETLFIEYSGNNNQIHQHELTVNPFYDITVNTTYTYNSAGLELRDYYDNGNGSPEMFLVTYEHL